MNINDLPREVLQQVFAYSFTDSFNTSCELSVRIRRVCKNWQETFDIMSLPIQSIIQNFLSKKLFVPLWDQFNVDIDMRNHILHEHYTDAVKEYFRSNTQTERLYLAIKNCYEIQVAALLKNENNSPIQAEFLQTCLYKSELPAEVREKINLAQSLIDRGDDLAIEAEEEFQMNLAQFLINQADPLCLGFVLKSDASIDNNLNIYTDEDPFDDEIDLTLDLFFLTFKKLLREGFRDPLLNESFKKMLTLVMAEERFIKHKEATFFSKLRRNCYDFPDYLAAIGLWKLIEEIDPSSPILHPQCFFEFLLYSEGREDYAQNEFNEILTFLPKLISKFDLQNAESLEESVHHVFFPLVFSHLLNKGDWYNTFLTECIRNDTPTNNANLKIILQAPTLTEAHIPDDYFQDALKVSWQMALLLIDDERIILPFDFEGVISNIQWTHGKDILLVIIDKLLATPRISASLKKICHKIRNRFESSSSHKNYGMSSSTTVPSSFLKMDIDSTNSEDEHEPPPKKHRKE